MADSDVDPAPMKQAMFTFTDRGTQLIQETVNFAELMMHLADLAGDLEVAETNLNISIEQVERIELKLTYLEVQHKAYIEWMNQHRDDYQDKCDEFAAAYNNASQAAKDAYKKEIIELFDEFRKAFEESNNQYIFMMNELTASLYEKAATVKQYSMVQRSMIMNLYQDFCDGLFYFSFKNCYADDDFPTMSDDFGSILQKLKNIQWDSITSMESWEGHLPETFTEVRKIILRIK